MFLLLFLVRVTSFPVKKMNMDYVDITFVPTWDDGEVSWERNIIEEYEEIIKIYPPTPIRQEYKLMTDTIMKYVPLSAVTVGIENGVYYETYDSLLQQSQQILYDNLLWKGTFSENFILFTALFLTLTKRKKKNKILRRLVEMNPTDVPKFHRITKTVTVWFLALVSIFAKNVASVL